MHIEEVPLPPYMDRPADTRAGCKHRCTDAAMEHFRAEVMELCHRENLYQIDLLHGSASRVTEREYWEKKKGQAKLDEKADALAAEGLPAKPTKFETDKEKLRKIIRKALDKAGSFDEFSSLLLQQGVIVKESRGRYSYLTPDRTKPITARKLGDDFDKTAVLAALERNALRPVNIVTKRDATRCRRICPRPDTAPAEHTDEPQLSAETVRAMLWCNQTGITTRDSDLPDLLDASDTRISRYQMTSFLFYLCTYELQPEG